MKKQCILYTLVFVLCGSISGCTDTIDFYQEDRQSAIVLNSLLNTDSIVYARMTWMNKPGAMYDYWTFNEIKDAEVSLYENGDFVERLAPVTIGDSLYNSHYYKSTHSVRQGQTYRLVATLPDGQRVSAEGWIPAQPSFSIGKAKWIPSPSNPGRDETQVDLKLNDPPGERNYYRIRIFTFFEGYVERRFQHFTWIGPGKQEANFFEDEFHQQVFIDDELFDGQSVELILRCENMLFENDRIEVTALTQESYRYLRNNAFANESVDNILTEPIPVYTNVTDGLGFVGGVAVREQNIEVDRTGAP
ncbi:DUF4249 domain-containing protein [Parapedobacter defluvii]|nr:DUF4249 domain-containing protein [Parapedobacter defluvii]